MKEEPIQHSHRSESDWIEIPVLKNQQKASITEHG